MMRVHPLLQTAFIALGLSDLALAQNTLLDEEFAGGAFPPSGWVEDNNGVSLGWEGVNGQAVHADWFGANDNALITPAMDFQGGTTFALHAVQDHLFSTYRERNAVEVSLDGGLSFVEIFAVEPMQDGSGLPLEVDLSAFAGQPDVRLAFRYQGDFANEWRLESVRVDDQAAQPPMRWPDLPTQFVDWDGYRVRFDEWGGVVPPFARANAVDAVTRLPDPEAWCNIGQQAPSQQAFSGAVALELGYDPAATNFHQVSSALIFGFRGSPGMNTAFEFRAWQLDSEADGDDGVFVSLDGVQWQRLRGDWELWTGGPDREAQWQRLWGDLSDLSLDLSGNFYLAIAAADDFPFGQQDGVAIDDLVCGDSISPLDFEVQNLVAGQAATFTVMGADSYSQIAVLYSLDGPGPSPTSYGMLELSAPVGQFPIRDVDRFGSLSFALDVPGMLSGRALWLQAVELSPYGQRSSRPLAETIQ